MLIKARSDWWQETEEESGRTTWNKGAAEFRIQGHYQKDKCTDLDHLEPWFLLMKMNESETGKKGKIIALVTYFKRQRDHLFK